MLEEHVLIFDERRDESDQSKMKRIWKCQNNPWVLLKT